MCLLSYYPPGIKPEPEYLQNGAAIHKDGHGWCVATPSKLIIYRGMQSDAAIERFMEVRQQHIGMPAMFHSRWGTSGVLGTYNVHPFLFGTDHRTAIAHNGVLFAGRDDDPRCDTRIFAETVMPRLFHRFDKPSAVKALEKHLGSANKIVAITINPRYQREAYIFNENAGTWADDGSWQSNTDYLGRNIGGWVVKSANGDLIEYESGGYWTKRADSNAWHYTKFNTDGSTYRSTVTSVKSSIRMSRFYGSCRHCGAIEAANYRITRCMVCYACLCCGDWHSPCTCGKGESVNEAEWQAWMEQSATGQQWLEADNARALMTAGDRPDDWDDTIER